MGTVATRVPPLPTRPDRDTWFIEPVVAEWWQSYVDSGALEKEHAIPGTRLRASWAGDCARALAYHVKGVEITDPPTVADVWRFNIGTLLHNHIQASIMAAFPGSQIEVKVRFSEDGSGHMDLLVVRPDGTTVSVEVKTINGTGFRRMMQPGGEGMRVKYLFQGAINAAAMDPQPDELVVAVFSLECLSPGEAGKLQVRNEYERFACQWTYPKQTYTAIAEREIRRMQRVVELVDESDDGYLNVPRLLPDPKLPKHRVSNPSKGTLSILDRSGENEIGKGWAWNCGYCSFQQQCIEDHEAGQ